MIKVFFGEDRLNAKKAIEKYFGADYEVIDCEELTLTDLPTIFFGTSLFTDERKILLRDFSLNATIYEKLPDYLNTPHRIALFESKLDKRTTTYKTLKDKIEFLEFIPPKPKNFNLVFNIYATAKHDGKKAVEMLREIELEEEPILFFGLLVSGALKDFAKKQGTKEKRVLQELSKVDLNLKSSTISSWLLIESFLLRLSSL